MIVQDHHKFRTLAESGKILVGIDPAVARKFFTDTSASLVEEQIGEPISTERIIVKAALFAGPIALLVSFYYAVVSFGWWAIAVIPVSVILWGSHAGRASIGRPRLWWMTMLLAGLTWLMISDPSSHYRWLVAIIGAMYLDRVKYRAAVIFLHALVVRNEKAYELLAETLILREA